MVNNDLVGPGNMAMSSENANFRFVRRERSSTTVSLMGEVITIEHSVSYRLSETVREVMIKVMDDPTVTVFETEWRRVVESDLELCFDTLKSQGQGDDRALHAIAFIIFANRELEDPWADDRRSTWTLVQSYRLTQVLGSNRPTPLLGILLRH